MKKTVKDEEFHILGLTPRSNRHREWVYGHQEGEAGRMNSETVIDMLALLILGIKQTGSENLVYISGNSTQCSVVT